MQDSLELRALCFTVSPSLPSVATCQRKTPALTGVCTAGREQNKREQLEGFPLDILQEHLLPKLPTAQLCNLGNTCTKWRLVVSKYISSALLETSLPAGKRVIPKGVLSSLKTTKELQTATRQQGRTMSLILHGSISQQDHITLLPHLPDCGDWSPWTPSAGHCWLATSTGNQLQASPLSTQSRGACSSSPGQQLPAETI